MKFLACSAWDLKVKLSSTIVEKKPLIDYEPKVASWKPGGHGVEKPLSEVGSVLSVLGNPLIVYVVENRGSFLLFIDNGGSFGIFIMVLYHQFWRNVGSWFHVVAAQWWWIQLIPWSAALEHLLISNKHPTEKHFAEHWTWLTLSLHVSACSNLSLLLTVLGSWRACW